MLLLVSTVFTKSPKYCVDLKYGYRKFCLSATESGPVSYSLTYETTNMLYLRVFIVAVKCQDSVTNTTRRPFRITFNASLFFSILYSACDQ